MRPDVLISIIISTRNKPWALLSKTLDSIMVSGSRDYEVVLVDQNSNSEIGSAIAGNTKYKDIIYIRSGETGLSRGRNLGITRSQGSWLLFFDDDAILPEDTLGKISPSLVRDQNGPIIFYGNVMRLDNNKPYLKRALTKGTNINTFNFDSVCSIALLFNRRIFDGTGLFDENMGAGTRFGAGEESDLILRALKKNYRITFLDEFNVLHPPPDSGDLQKRNSYGMGTGAVYRKHVFSSPLLSLVLSFKLLMEMVIRGILILSNIGSANSRRYHSCYLQGMIEGFSSFDPAANEKNNCF